MKIIWLICVLLVMAVPGGCGPTITQVGDRVIMTTEWCGADGKGFHVDYVIPGGIESAIAKLRGVDYVAVHQKYSVYIEIGKVFKWEDVEPQIIKLLRGPMESMEPVVQMYHISTDTRRFYIGVELTDELMDLIVNIKDVRHVGRDRDNLDLVMVGVDSTSFWWHVAPQVSKVISDYLHTSPEWLTLFLQCGGT
jgi:hypothetical protein